MGGVNDEEPHDRGEYCRQVEAYLCRKNDGHLVRIAGPSFARVCGWSDAGIPLSVVYRGIDRYFERYYSRGPRRRPVHVDFCEADVLDVFDEWRRAVGVDVTAPAPEPPRRHASLPGHLERAIARLTALRAGGRLSPSSDRIVAEAVRELDLARGRAAHSRGETRAALLARLAEIDADVVTAARESAGEAEWQAIEQEARETMASFKQGMTAEAHDRAVAVSARRLLRERFGLPVVAYEE